MGFEIPGTVVLTFEGAFAGLEIRCRLGLPIREQLEIRRLTRDLDFDADDGAFERVFREWFARVRPTWNVEQEGQPVECSADALLQMLPGEILIQIMPKWREAMGVAGPLGNASGSGGTSREPLTDELANQSESLSS